MKLIVTGGRDYSNKEKLFEVLLSLSPTLIIQGGASGADYLARLFASQTNTPLKTYKADWDAHGRAAGPIRNKLMLTENTDAVVIAFPGGKGTDNCVREAKKLGMKVLEVDAN